MRVTPDGDDASERRRVELLLDVHGEPGLDEAEPEGYPGPGTAEWAVGYRDEEHGLAVTVWFVRDPELRSQAASRLDTSGARVVMNGGLLMVARSGRDDDTTARRLRRLVSRFAGAE
ncbi:MAG: hypothetical protein KY469_09950 [Actinobacteria bacterium]|nr:hypothetical protein [Actinomycetota bacterium]